MVDTHCPQQLDTTAAVSPSMHSGGERAHVACAALQSYGAQHAAGYGEPSTGGLHTPPWSSQAPVQTPASGRVRELAPPPPLLEDTPMLELAPTEDAPWEVVLLPELPLDDAPSEDPVLEGPPAAEDAEDESEDPEDRLEEGVPLEEELLDDELLEEELLEEELLVG